MRKSPISQEKTNSNDIEDVCSKLIQRYRLKIKSRSLFKGCLCPVSASAYLSEKIVPTLTNVIGVVVPSISNKSALTPDRRSLDSVALRFLLSIVTF